MPRSRKGFNQTRKRRVERSRILIVTEGVKTEKQYLEGLLQVLRNAGTTVKSAVVSKGIGLDPMRVVDAAVAFNERDLEGGYDETWVVVDVDTHTTLDDAIAAVADLGYTLVVSNPCFEIWLIWHYEDCGGHRTPKQAARQLVKHKHSDKGLPNTFPFQNHPEATRRAGGGSATGARGANPSTAMPHLIAALERRP